MTDFYLAFHDQAAADAVLYTLHPEVVEDDGITITEERARVVDFSAPYMQVNQRLLVRRDESRFDSLAAFAATPAARIGAQKGNTNYTKAEKLVGPARVVAFEVLMLAQHHGERLAFVQVPRVRGHAQTRARVFDCAVSAHDDRVPRAAPVLDARRVAIGARVPLAVTLAQLGGASACEVVAVSSAAREKKRVRVP
jgi:hypothetical protein